MNVAIPKLKDKVAPCFEAAKLFEIISIENAKQVSHKTVECLAGEGFKRIRLLHLHEINTLICNGIKEFYRNQLAAIGIMVIPNINDSIEQALVRFLADDFPVYINNDIKSRENYDISHDDLINWAKDIFETHGYTVAFNSSRDSFLVDLVAEIQCPQCAKTIRVAICCGGHTYRPDQEIQEFHHSAKSIFNIRAFIYTDSPQIAKSCREYGIEFISPETLNFIKDKPTEFEIPIFTGPIEGHDKLIVHGDLNKF